MSFCAEAPGTSAIIEHRQNSKSMMVWARICATGKTPLVFVNEGEKFTKTFTVVTYGCRGSSRDPSPLWPTTMDTSTRFRSSPQSESEAEEVQGPFSRRHHICGMAAQLARSQFWRPEPVLGTTKIRRILISCEFCVLPLYYDININIILINVGYLIKY